MRRFPLLCRFLIALGFVAAQAVALVHATSHELKPDNGASCEVCALAHAAGGTPVVADASALVLPQAVERVQPLLAAAAAPCYILPPSRGPPSILV